MLAPLPSAAPGPSGRVARSSTKLTPIAEQYSDAVAAAAHAADTFEYFEENDDDFAAEFDIGYGEEEEEELLLAMDEDESSGVATPPRSWAV